MICIKRIPVTTPSQPVCRPFRARHPCWGLVVSRDWPTSVNVNTVCYHAHMCMCKHAHLYRSASADTACHPRPASHAHDRQPSITDTGGFNNSIDCKSNSPPWCNISTTINISSLTFYEMTTSVSCRIETYDTGQPNVSPIRHEPFIYFRWRPHASPLYQAMVLFGSSQAGKQH